MGYTHYWSNFSALPDQAVADIQHLILLNAGLVQFESDVQEAPVVDTKEVRFNGVEDDAYETFCLSGGSWDFCKTAQRPYDKIVVAVLVIVAHYLPDFEWSSDGDDEDLAEGKELAQKYLK